MEATPRARKARRSGRKAAPTAAVGADSTAAAAPDRGEQSAPKPRSSGRAGRDLRAAIAVGVSLGAAVLVTLFTLRVLFIVLVAAAIALGAYELVRALQTSPVTQLRLPMVVLVPGAAALPVVAYAAGQQGLVVGLFVVVLLALAWRVLVPAPRVSADAFLRDVAATCLTCLYVGFLAGFAGLLARPSDGAARVVAFIASAVASDVGGYTAGVLTGGRHKMAPRISPGKSWEGAAGSVVAGGLLGALLFAFTFHRPVWQGILFGLAAVAAAVVGDLGESLLKRDMQIKDMGNLLPGHGGLMDRLDSLLITAPVAWLLLSAWTGAP